MPQAIYQEASPRSRHMMQCVSRVWIAGIGSFVTQLDVVVPGKMAPASVERRLAARARRLPNVSSLSVEVSMYDELPVGGPLTNSIL